MKKLIKKILREEGEPFTYEGNFEWAKGDVKEYYPSGNVKETVTFKSHRKHGDWITYYENGEIESKGKFAANRRVGIWIYYDKSGNIIKKETYENNKLVDEEIF